LDVLPSLRAVFCAQAELSRLNTVNLIQYVELSIRLRDVRYWVTVYSVVDIISIRGAVCLMTCGINI